MILPHCHSFCEGNRMAVKQSSGAFFSATLISNVLRFLEKVLSNNHVYLTTQELQFSRNKLCNCTNGKLIHTDLPRIRFSLLNKANWLHSWLTDCLHFNEAEFFKLWCINCMIHLKNAKSNSSCRCTNHRWQSFQEIRIEWKTEISSHHYIIKDRLIVKMAKHSCSKKHQTEMGNLCNFGKQIVCLELGLASQLDKLSQNGTKSCQQAISPTKNIFFWEKNAFQFCRSQRTANYCQ